MNTTQDFKEQKKSGKHNTKDHDNFLVTDPPKYEDLQIAWQRIQNNCFKEIQWTTIKHRSDSMK